MGLSKEGYKLQVLENGVISSYKYSCIVTLIITFLSK